MSDKQRRSWPKLLSIWMNAIADAWNMGEAPWAFEGGRSVAVRLWSRCFEETGDEQRATEAVVELARAMGVDPKRHRVHG